MVFRMLQENNIPITDKIFPWVVDATISRVQTGLLRQEMEELQRQLKVLPSTMASECARVMKEPLQGIYLAQLATEQLTMELRTAAVIEASLSQSGWRGIGAALGGIFRLGNLRWVVGAIVWVSMGMGATVAWQVSAGERRILEFNRGIVQECEQSYASDQDGNGWYTCPLFQLPMTRE